MAKVVSGQRFLRSMATPVNTQVNTALDFDLGARLAIQIEWVLGITSYITETPGADATASMLQSLHLETDTPEDIPFLTGEDAVNIDTEAFFVQMNVFQFDLTTSGAGRAYHPNHLYIPYSPPIIAARNLIHRVDASGATREAMGMVLMGYRYVELTDQELIGVLTTRR